MTGVRETALWIDCAGAAMLGVIAEPLGPPASKTGVLILVGGPQYRVGSHRQFTLLARRLSAAGFPTLRFDYRGMGDSEGERQGFMDTAPDITAAARALRERANVENVVLWGLCDAASAILLGPAQTDGVAGLVLVNPWVRSEASLGAARLKHYYAARLVEPGFWRKGLTGGIEWRASLTSLLQSIRASVRGRIAFGAGATEPFQTRMARSLASFRGPVLVALSGNDITGREFADHAGRDPHWRGLLERPQVRRVLLDEADHTFSRAAWRSWLEDRTLEWLEHARGDGGFSKAEGLP